MPRLAVRVLDTAHEPRDHIKRVGQGRQRRRRPPTTASPASLETFSPARVFFELLSPLGVFMLHRSHFLGPGGESASPGFFHDTPTHRGERAGVEFINGKKPGVRLRATRTVVG